MPRTRSEGILVRSSEGRAGSLSAVQIAIEKHAFTDVFARVAQCQEPRNANHFGMQAVHPRLQENFSRRWNFLQRFILGCLPFHSRLTIGHHTAPRLEGFWPKNPARLWVQKRPSNVPNQEISRPETLSAHTSGVVSQARIAPSDVHLIEK